MLSRLGLRARMAVSYVVVSAAAVLAVEAVLLAVLVPRLTAAGDDAAAARQRAFAAERTAMQLKVEFQAAQTAATAADRLRAGSAFTAAGLRGGDGPTGLVVALATVDGAVLGSDPPGRFARLPVGAGSAASSGTTEVDGRPAVWAVHPVTDADQRVVGVAWAALVVPADKPVTRPGPSVQGYVAPGLVALVLLVPVGALFGVLSTGRLIRRVRRLAASAAMLAGGGPHTRVPVSGADEVGRLEQAFNTMAEQLDEAGAEQRRAAGTQARRAERDRIARELHDAISQELFSANLVAGGLRKALPAGSDLRDQAEAMERSLGRTMREMRAMLLELRPVALEDAGLADALAELCRAYGERLGVEVTTEVDPVPLPAPVEHAVLRIVQETVANATRHGEPRAVAVRVGVDEGWVDVAVRDDGRGFDPGAAAERHGLGLPLMRDRVAELGGTMEVVSAPDAGTTVRVRLPVPVPGGGA